jgi:low affinity Fe/Cu permease
MPTPAKLESSRAQRPRTSRAVHLVNEMTTRPTMAIVVAVAVAVSWVVVIASGFDSDVQFVFGNLCASITLVMVFVLQHTQRREQLAFQLKLDELVHASPEANDRLVAVEASSDEEMLDLEERRLEHHVAARRDTHA